MEKIYIPNSPEYKAHQKGFLFGFYEGFMDLEELKDKCPYIEEDLRKAWFEGYYWNFR